MNDTIGNVAQELADHLDDLKDTKHGVTDYDGDGRSFPVSEVGDAELVEGFVVGSRFFVTVSGQRLKVTVSEA